MIRGTLVTAMDFAARKGVKNEAYSYRRRGKWYIVTSGPRYCNVTEVTEYDDNGLKLLLEKEDREVTALHTEPDKPFDSPHPA